MNDPQPQPRNKPQWALWLPLAIFAGFVTLVAVGLLWPANHDVASAMIGKPLPQFTLRAAIDERPGVSTGDFTKGTPRLLNIFASWCIPCAAEAQQLSALKAQGVEINGIAIRDQRADLTAFLARNGNPYASIGADDDRALQLAIGSSGVPETFVIDGKGVIRYQHIGEIRSDQLPMILEKLREAGE